MSTALDDWDALDAQRRIYTHCVSAGGRKALLDGTGVRMLIHDPAHLSPSGDNLNGSSASGEEKGAA